MTALERNNSIHRADEPDDALAAEEDSPVLAPESIPCCMRPVIQLVYYNLLRPTDGYLTRVRKAWLLIAVIIGTITPIIGFRILREHPDEPAAVAYAVSCIIMVGWHVLHAYVRYTRRMSNAATFIAVNIASVAVVMSVPLTVDFPHAPILMLQMQFCGMLATPFFVPNIVFLALATAVGYFNIAAIERGEFVTAPLMVNGIFFQTFSDRLPRYLLVTAAAVGTAMLGRFMVSEFQRITVRSGRSAATAAIVTSLLRRYNTERARVVLEAAAMTFDLDTSAADSDVVDPITAIDSLGPHATAEELTPFLAGADPRLLESLKEMVQNLEAYRGHLPNWMLDAAMNSGGTESDEEGDLARLAASHEPASDDCRSQLGRSASSRHSDGSSSRNRLHESIRRSATGSDPAQKTPQGLATRQVARARIDVRFPAKDRIAVSTQLAVANSLIDRVLALARSTHGAVHTFLGDSIQLSWNAAAPVAQPDVKAVRFLARARAMAMSMMDEHAVATRSPQPAAQLHQVDGSTVTAADAEVAPTADEALCISGAAITGSARVAMAGTGIQRMLYVNSEGAASALALAAALAQRTGSFLCDGASAEAAIDVVTRGVAAVACAGKPTPMELHEVIAENASGASDEWLYVVRDMQNAGNPHETCTALLRSVLLESSFSEARAIADKIPAEYVSALASGSPALVLRLLEAARSDAHNNALEKLVLA